MCLTDRANALASLQRHHHACSEGTTPKLAQPGWERLEQQHIDAALNKPLLPRPRKGAHLEFQIVEHSSDSAGAPVKYWVSGEVLSTNASTQAFRARLGYDDSTTGVELYQATIPTHFAVPLASSLQCIVY